MMKFDPKGTSPLVPWIVFVCWGSGLMGVNARVWFDMKKMSGKALRAVDLNAPGKK